MTSNQKKLMWTLLIISAFQMAHICLQSGISTIAGIFPDRSLTTIQTVMNLANLLQPIFAIITALIVSRITKKWSVVIGVLIVGLSGVFAIFFHSEFWQLCMYSILIGAGMGCFIPIVVSIICDNFNEADTQRISGYQTSFINGGGLILSILAGLITSKVWFGGFILLVAIIPVAILAIIYIPQDKPIVASKETGVKRSKPPFEAFYFGAVLFFYTLLYVVYTANISSLLAESKIGGPATSGLATGILMGGAAVMGFIFARVYNKFQALTLSVSFSMLFIGYLLIGIFSHSLPIILIGSAIAGASISLAMPSVIFSVSKHVDETNSAISSIIFMTIAPGIGGFISPSICTNLTLALFGENVKARFIFFAFVALAIAIIYMFANMIYEKKRLNK